MNIEKLVDSMTEEEKKEAYETLYQNLGVPFKIQDKESVYFEPKENEEYFIIDHFFEPNKYLWQDRVFDCRRFNNGNCFRTEQEAQARIDLRRHIVAMNWKYGRYIEYVWYLDAQQKWQLIKSNNYTQLQLIMSYDCPDNIHDNSTDEERAERLRLIQAVYGGE
jgi:hypothetical protein